MQPRPGPLAELGALLGSFRPPVASALKELLRGVEDYHRFMGELVLEYLPEHLEEIKALPNASARITRFAELFQPRYFPLAWIFQEPWDEEMGYEDLFGYTDWGGAGGIPIERQGIDYDDLHEVENFSPGYLLLGSLVMTGYMDASDQGVADVWLEACEARTKVSMETLRRIPEASWRTDELRRYLKGTKWEAAAEFAEYLTQSTGNAFLDTNNDMGFSDPWERETVDILVVQWAAARRHHDQVHDLADLLEGDPDYFTEMLDFIFQRERELEEPREPRTLMEVFAEEDNADE